MRTFYLVVAVTANGCSALAGFGDYHVAADSGTDARIAEDISHPDSRMADGSVEASDATRDISDEVADAGADAPDGGVIRVEILCNGEDDDGNGQIDGPGCWRRMPDLDGFEGRVGHRAVVDPVGNQWLIWGGAGRGGAINTGALYDAPTGVWTPMTLADAPSSRYTHGATWARDRMVIWGGYNGASLRSGGLYDPNSNSWIATNLVEAPDERYNPTVTWIPDRLDPSGDVVVVFGGNNSGTLRSSGGRYYPGTDSWLPMSLDGAPSPREDHRAAWNPRNDTLIVFGGVGPELLNTGGIYNPVADTWVNTTLDGTPLPRVAPCFSWVDEAGAMLLVGGRGGGNTGAFFYPPNGFDPEGRWVPISSDGAPAVDHCLGVFTDGDPREMVVLWGDAASRVVVGARYSPREDRWRPIPAEVDSPPARSFFSIAWLGSQVCIWGGLIPPDGDRLGDGYCYAIR